MEAPRQVVEAEYVITAAANHANKEEEARFLCRICSAANVQLLRRKKTCEKRPDGKVAFV